MAQKLIVSKSGFDALTETDPRNLIFDSSLNYLKTSQSGSITLASTTGDTVYGTVSHNLGYRPLTLAYFNIPGDNKWYINFSSGFSQNPQFNLFDNNTVIFSYAPIDPGTAQVLYEIFYEGDQ